MGQESFMAGARTVSEAHNQGRRLYIGTTSMDAQKLTVWNMGLIAQSNRPEALSLFRAILLASASIPTAMPPVYIPVEVEGKEYDEMHSDGGTVAQFFVHAGTFSFVEASKKVGLQFNSNFYNQLYIIINGKLEPIPKHIPRTLTAVSTRALNTLIKASMYNNLYRLYFHSQREKSAFFYTSIPRYYVSQSNEYFDQAEMI